MTKKTYTWDDKQSKIITIDYANNLNTNYGNVYSTSTASANINFDDYSKLINQLTNSLGVPRSVLDPYPADPTPLTTDKYPITHDAYKLINRGPTTVRTFLKNAIGITSCDKEIEELAAKVQEGNKEVYAAVLRRARIHLSQIPTDQQKQLHEEVEDGHVYDPWFRCISKLGVGKYKIVTADTIDDIRTLYNTRESLFYCVLDTTIDGTPVRIFLYDILTISYVNKRKVEKYLQTLSPFEQLVEPNYELT